MSIIYIITIFINTCIAIKIQIFPDRYTYIYYDLYMDKLYIFIYFICMYCYIYIDIDKQLYMYLYIYIYKYIHTCMYVYIYKYVYVYKYKYKQGYKLIAFITVIYTRNTLIE